MLETLVQAIQRRAEACGWDARRSDRLLQDPSESLRAALAVLDDDYTAPASPETVPAHRIALELVPASICVLLCTLSEADASASYRQALWWTGLVRSQLPPTERSDLHLVLVASRGSVASEKWRNIRSKYESDERFCRKFVFLPSEEVKPGEIETFLDRTFFAQPWLGERAEPRSLDLLAELAETVAGQHLSSEQASSWIEALASAESAPAALAETLVSLLEES